MAEPPGPAELDSYVPPPEALDDALLDLPSLPPFSTKYRLTLRDKSDLQRLCLKSDLAELEFPGLGIEEGSGTGAFGTVESVLKKVLHSVTESLQFFPKESDQYSRMQEILSTLEGYASGEEESFPFMLSIRDVSSQSFFSLKPGSIHERVADDPQIQVIRRDRQFEEVVNVGLAETLLPDEQWEVTGEDDQAKEVIEGAYNALFEAIKSAKKVVIFSGAGVSTESKLPAYRTPGADDNLWDKYSDEDGHISNFFASAETRKRYWTMHMEFEELLSKATPNPAHELAEKLQSAGKLLAVCTQNIDGLYTMAGVRDENLIELHGTCTKVRCMADGCPFKMPAAEAHKRWMEEPGREMLCDKCGDGLLKPDTISFGQSLDDAVIERAIAVHEECDLLLVMGSSLVVSPACRLPGLALVRKVPLFLINLGETMYDPFAVATFNDYVGKFSQKVLDTCLT